MFTGIVEELGIVKTMTKRASFWRLGVEANKVIEDMKIGDSVSVNGVCLTAVEIFDHFCTFDVMMETFHNTTLKSIRQRSKVNLERALRVGDRLGGHFVTGHVDYVGVVRSRRIKKGNYELGISLPSAYRKLVVKKGSVAVDGVSLTVADVRQGCFVVCIIPHTAKATLLGLYKSSDCVNIEVDALLKR